MLLAREPKRNKRIYYHVLALEAHAQQNTCTQRHAIPTNYSTYCKQNLTDNHEAHNYEHRAMDTENLVIDQVSSNETQNDIGKCIKCI